MKTRSQQPLPASIDAYFSMCGIVQRIKNQFDMPIYDLRHESLVQNPMGTLKDLCGFLDLSADDKYYEDCASIIYKSVHKSRTEIEWTAELIDSVKEQISRFNFFSGYAYDD